MSMSYRISLTIVVSACTTFWGAAEEGGDQGLEITRTAHGIRVMVRGEPFAEYVVDQANKPYLYPVYGPTGEQMTRAYPMKTIEGERHDHPHHRGINFGHQSIGGVDTWTEQLTWDEFTKDPKKAKLVQARSKNLGRIRHVKFTKLEAGESNAVVVAMCNYLAAAGRKFLTEERRMRFHVGHGIRMIDIDQDLIANEGKIRFADIKDAGLSIRVPTSMAVTSRQGGTILNSEGDRDRKAWSKSAEWCDYSGPVHGKTLGIAVLNHPSSFRHPTRWHAREYGLLTANPFASKKFIRSLPDTSFDLAKGERIKLRHRFILHAGTAEAAGIAEAFKLYAKEPR